MWGGGTGSRGDLSDLIHLSYNGSTPIHYQEIPGDVKI